MRRLLAISATVIVGGIATATAASADPAPTSTPDTILCIQSKTLTVAGHTLTTPQVCVPVPIGASS